MRRNEGRSRLLAGQQNNLQKILTIDAANRLLPREEKLENLRAALNRFTHVCGES
jgi:hypothetical protein